MGRQTLTDYIARQRQLGVTEQAIHERLTAAGWPEQDVQRAWGEHTPQPASAISNAVPWQIKITAALIFLGCLVALVAAGALVLFGIELMLGLWNGDSPPPALFRQPLFQYGLVALLCGIIPLLISFRIARNSYRKRHTE